MRYVISGIMVIATMGMWYAGAVMNFRFGMTLSQELGVASVAADVFKALVPFAIWWAWKHNRQTVVLVGSAMWLICTAYSVTSALGYAVLKRSTVTSERATQGTLAKKDVAELNRLTKRLERLGEYGDPGQIKKQLEAKRQHTRWTSTKGCTDATVIESRTFCTDYKNLESQISAARAGEKLEKRMAVLKNRIRKNSKVAGGSDISSGDPQADILSKLTGFELGFVQSALVILVAGLVELVSGLGFFVALNHGEITSVRVRRLPREEPDEVHEHVHQDVVAPEPKKPSTALTVKRKVTKPKLQLVPPAEPVGDVAKFAVACLVVEPTARLQVSDLHEDYKQWCVDESCYPLDRAEFIKTFSALCDALGLQKQGRGSKLSCIGMQRAS